MSRTIPWWEPQIGQRELPLLQKALEAHYPNNGPLAADFEAQVAERMGVAHAIATTSGTAALFLALAAHGIGPDDEVIVPDSTFIATANAVRLAGATVVLVDVHRDTLNMDPSAFERAITPRTKAVIPVHVSGRGADMVAINRIADAHSIAVIEDAAEAWGSFKDGKPLGTFGAAGCFSLSANKTITSGQGGVLVTNNDALAERIRALRAQGIAGRATGGDDVHPTVGYNFKWTDLQAAVALGQLALLDERTARMRELRAQYAAQLAEVPEIIFYPFDLAGKETPQWTDIRAERRDELDAALRAQGMDCRRFWHPLHREAPYAKPDTAFPVTTEIVPQSLWLPSAFTLTDTEIARVCQAIKAFYGRA